MVESIIFTSLSYTLQSGKELLALNIFIGKNCGWNGFYPIFLSQHKWASLYGIGIPF